MPRATNYPPTLITDLSPNLALSLAPEANPVNLVMQLLCLLQHVGERAGGEREKKKREREYEFAPFMNPTMSEGYNKTLDPGIMQVCNSAWSGV